MAYGYVVKKGREFRVPSGKRFKTGDAMLVGDDAREVEKDENRHLLHHLIRVEAPEAEAPKSVATAAAAPVVEAKS